MYNPLAYIDLYRPDTLESVMVLVIQCGAVALTVHKEKILYPKEGYVNYRSEPQMLLPKSSQRIMLNIWTGHIFTRVYLSVI